VRVRATGGGVEIQVCDHGPGIPDGEAEQAFEPFRRLGRAEGAGGAGLGLALVRQIARHHGGEARYQGRGDGRSGFVVTLPAAIRPT
jgi:signal transduction histidine kinase